MKTTIFTILSGVFLISISCVKEYNCQCTDKDQNDSIVAEKTHVIEAKKYGEAETMCNDMDGEYTVYTRDCKLTSF